MWAAFSCSFNPLLVSYVLAHISPSNSVIRSAGSRQRPRGAHRGGCPRRGYRRGQQKSASHESIPSGTLGDSRLPSSKSLQVSSYGCVCTSRWRTVFVLVHGLHVTLQLALDVIDWIVRFPVTAQPVTRVKCFVVSRHIVPTTHRGRRRGSR